MKIRAITFWALLILAACGAANAKDIQLRRPLVWNFSLEEDAKQWAQSKGDVTTGGLHLELNELSTTTLMLKQEIEADSYNMFRLNVAIMPPVRMPIYLEWDTGEGFKAENRLELTHPGSLGDTRLSANLSASKSWYGTVQHLRLQFPKGTAAAVISAVRLFYRPEDEQGTAGAQKIDWVYDINAARKLETTERPIMFYIFDLTDPRCRLVSSTLFEDPQFIEATRDFLCIRYLSWEKEKYSPYIENVVMVPTFIFAVRERVDMFKNNYIEVERVEGYHTPDQFQRYFSLIDKKLETLSEEKE